MKKATRQHTKEHNRNLVLKTIFDHESISRAEIARITSLTRTTVSDIVSDLIAEGLVKEVGIGPSIGGKSPILLGLAEDSRYLIGLDLSYEEFRGAIVNLSSVAGVHGNRQAGLEVAERRGFHELAIDVVRHGHPGGDALMQGKGRENMRELAATASACYRTRREPGAGGSGPGVPYRPASARSPGGRCSRRRR